MNYYNEFDPAAAAGIKQLIELPRGEVDTRSILDVKAADLKGFNQCHFFAGIGGWSLALQIACWPETKPVWTGSPPCQPYSMNGKKKGKSDERDLWPTWFSLIRKCRPTIIFGEQVAESISHGWLDRLHLDLEKEKYAIGSAVLPACSVNAPHKRNRVFFVAYSESGRRSRERISSKKELQTVGDKKVYPEAWQDTELVLCRDRKYRKIPPNKSGVHLLANGFPLSVALLRTSGNAIVPEIASRFIKSAM